VSVGITGAGIFTLQAPQVMGVVIVYWPALF